MAPSDDVVSATTATRGSRCKLLTLGRPSTLIMKIASEVGRNHIGVAQGPPSGPTAARGTTSRAARYAWTLWLDRLSGDLMATRILCLGAWHILSASGGSPIGSVLTLRRK